jgi:cysteinyl-tRNA synthetase
MLQAHYRTVYNFTFDGVKAAGAARKKIQDYVYDCEERARGAAATGAVGERLRTSVYAELADDLHTPKAVAALFTFMNDTPASSLGAEDAASVLHALTDVNAVFGVVTIGPRPEVAVPDNVAALAAERWQARQNKDWPASDRLRDEIAALGWTMRDGKDGYTLEPTA